MWEEEAEAPVTLSINKGFAERFEKKKAREELSKLEDKFGKRNLSDLDENEEDEEDAEVEDEDGELVTPEIDAQIMKTLVLIKSKDPAVYDSSKSFFSEEEIQKARNEWIKKQKALKAEGKPMTLKDYQREVLLKHGGHVDEEQEVKKIREKTHVEEQAELKESFKKAAFGFDGDNGGDDEDDSGLLVKREKTKEEEAAEEDDYKNFLLEQLAQASSSKEAFDEWRSYKNNSKVKEDDAFLMDYILNRGWVDKDAHRTPTYQEIVENEDDEEEVERAEEFEHVYNFRFEEEGGAQIQSYGRNIPDSLRREKSTRKEARLAKAAREAEEKQKKAEEIKRLKNLKKKEIWEKLKKIQEIAGTEDVGLEEVDLEGDFNPDDYDQKMSSIFSDNFYEAEADKKKPVFDDDIDISDILPQPAHPTAGEQEKEQEQGEDVSETKKNKKRKKKKNEEENDEDDFIMDADYLEESQHAASRKKSKEDPSASSSSAVGSKSGKKNFDEYLDEFYKLDYEDVIGDLPTRFKYRQVQPTSFGLTLKDILRADDKTLNEFVSLKKLAPYRPLDRQEKDEKKLSKKKRLREFRRRVKEASNAKRPSTKKVKTEKAGDKPEKNEPEENDDEE